MQCRIQRTGVLRSRVERPAIPALCSVGGCASALRRCLAGRRRPPAFARPITVVLPASGDVHPDGHGLQSCPADNAGAGGGVATPEICSELAKTATDFHNNGEFRVVIRPIAPQNGFFPQPARLEQCAGNSRRLAELIPSKSAFRSSMPAHDSAIMMLSSEVSSVVFPAAREAYRDRSAAGLRATLRRRATRSRAARREILLPTARSVGKPPRG